MDRKSLFPLIGHRKVADAAGETSEGMGEAAAAPMSKARGQAVQRLQVGLLGILAMVLVIGLAATLTQRAQTAEDAAVPEAAPTTEPVEADAQSDPLADAGVVPELPDEPEEEAVQEPAVAPEQGEGANIETEVEDIEAQ